jgi:hypothetical protein
LFLPGCVNHTSATYRLISLCYTLEPLTRLTQTCAPLLLMMLLLLLRLDDP